MYLFYTVALLCILICNIYDENVLFLRIIISVVLWSTGSNSSMSSMSEEPLHISILFDNNVLSERKNRTQLSNDAIKYLASSPRNTNVT